MKNKPKNPFDYDHDQSIDILNEELYHKNKKYSQKKRRAIHERNIQIENDFDDNFDELLRVKKKRVLPTSLFKKIFFVTLFFFVFTAVVAFFSLYQGKKEVSDNLISMEILGQPFVDGGEKLELKVRLQNFNEKSLQLPDLVLSYPKDSNTNGGEVFLRRSLKDIKQNQRVDETFFVNLFGQEGDIRNIKAVLEYRIEGSSSIFVKEAMHKVAIRSTPTYLSMRGPKSLVENQDIILNIDVSSNSTKQLNDLLLSVNYPLGFEFISSNREPNFGNHTWHFSSVTNEKESLEIVGRLSALPGEGQSFHAKLGKQDRSQPNKIETVFNSSVHSVDVEQSFILINMQLNDDADGNVVIRGGDDIDLVIEYENTLTETLADAQITLDINGDLYSPEGLFVSRGDFNSNTNRITWNKNSLEALDFLDPGETGRVRVSIPTRDLVSETGTISNPNFSVNVNVSATELNGNVREAVNVASSKVHANSDIELDAKTLHFSGPFKNKGEVPPKIGRETEYTITLEAKNSSNDIAGAKVVTFLPPYVTWLGNIAPSVERQKVSYNETTREILWDIGALKSGVGFGDIRSKQMSFQISALPSLPHVGENLDLTKEIIFTGKDVFTGTHLSFKKRASTTRLNHDPDAELSDGRVAQ